MAEAYPDLKANQNFLALQNELTATEDRIAAGAALLQRQRARAQHQGRDGPVQHRRRHVHFDRAEYFEAEGIEREAPQVSFGGPGAGTGQIGPGGSTADHPGRSAGHHPPGRPGRPARGPDHCPDRVAGHPGPQDGGMARYQVTVDVEKGPRLHRTLRARSAQAAYQSVRSTLIEQGVDPRAHCLASVRRRRRFRPSVLIAGGPWADGGDDGSAGVREPRRPLPSPPSLSARLLPPRDR